VARLHARNVDITRVGPGRAGNVGSGEDPSRNDYRRSLPGLGNEGGESSRLIPVSSNKQEERRANMNEDVLKGKWKEIKGGVKEKWGKLTDDDLTQVEGNIEKLLGLLQQKYGYAKDKAEQEYKDFIGRYKERAGERRTRQDRRRA
jgi:uncharacterized protein YjbJ (UPF0337 family)